MKYSGQRKQLCELSKLSKLNAFILLGYQTNTDASILVYKFRPERTGFNMYACNFPCIKSLLLVLYTKQNTPYICIRSINNNCRNLFYSMYCMNCMYCMDYGRIASTELNLYFQFHLKRSGMTKSTQCNIKIDTYLLNRIQLVCN